MRKRSVVHGLAFLALGALMTLVPILASIGFAAGAPVTPTQAQAGRQVRELVLVTWPQAQDPQQYEAARIAAEGMRRLGLRVTVRTMP